MHSNKIVKNLLNELFLFLLSVKTVTLGESGVGKTSLVKKYVENSFDDKLPSTVGADISIKNLEFDGLTIQLMIWDTAGQEVFRSLVEQYLRDASLALIVFSLSDRKSFECARDYWINYLLEKSPDTIMIIVGNKLDLEREVTEDEANDLAAKYKTEYFETSALQGIGVDEAFEMLASKYVKSINTPDSNKDNKNVNLHSETNKQTEDEGCC